MNLYLLYQSLIVYFHLAPSLKAPSTAKSVDYRCQFAASGGPQSCLIARSYFLGPLSTHSDQEFLCQCLLSTAGKDHLLAPLTRKTFFRSRR